MFKLKTLIVLVALLVAFCQPCFAADNTKVIGVWRLVAFEIESQTTGQKEPVMGENPTGYLSLSAEGRAFVILTGEGRMAPKSVQDRADLFNSVISYTGKYRVEGDKWITKVDVASIPDFVGSDQSRFFRVEGNRLYVLTPWGIHPNWPEKGTTRRVLTFVRDE